MRKLLLLLSLLVIANHSTSLYAASVSFDQLAVSGDLTVAKYNADMDRIYIKVNDAIQSSNVENNSLQDSSVSSDFSTNASPSTRTLEGASCEKVFTGLLTATTSGTLVGTVPAGTAYPQGRRVRRDTALSRTWTANRWTFVDIDHNNDLFFQEVTVGGATPSVTANAIRISRVSTDATQILAVQDLRTTNCSDGPFQDIVDTANEGSLDDMFTFGRRTISADNGYIQGLQISYDTATSFRVLRGSARINGLFRILEDTSRSVPSTNDVPVDATSGLDTGTLGASTRYYVYAVADKASSRELSITYSTNATTPSGVTNFRRLGEIQTDSNSQFISRDVSAYHDIHENLLATSWIEYNGNGAFSLLDETTGSQNVSSITDTGTGNHIIFWDTDYEKSTYPVSAMCEDTSASSHTCQAAGIGGNAAGTAPDKTAGRISVRWLDNAGAALRDNSRDMVIAYGRLKR